MDDLRSNHWIMKHVVFSACSFWNAGQPNWGSLAWWSGTSQRWSPWNRKVQAGQFPLYPIVWTVCWIDHWDPLILGPYHSHTGSDEDGLGGEASLNELISGFEISHFFKFLHISSPRLTLESNCVECAGCSDVQCSDSMIFASRMRIVCHCLRWLTFVC